MNFEREIYLADGILKLTELPPFPISILRPLCNPIAVTPPLRTAAGVLEIITQAVLTLKTSYVESNEHSLPTPWHTGHIKLSSHWIRMVIL